MNEDKKQEFFIKIQKANPSLSFDNAVYVNRKHLMTATCQIHGNFQMQAGSFLNTVTCPECDLEKRKQEFIQKAKDVHGDKYDYSKVIYKTNKIPVEIICPIHGSFMQAPGDHKKGYGCSKCSKKYKPTSEEWIERAKQVHPQYDYSRVVYKDNKTPVEIICKEHGSFFPCPNNFLKSPIGCPKCNDIRKHNDYTKTTEQFIKDAIKVHGTKYDYSLVKYHDKTEKVCIICPEHGEFWQSPSVHLRGCGCQKCVNKNQTILWERLCKEFKDEEILYEIGSNIVPWLDSLRFDMYFPKYNIAVEYDGEQHFMPIEIYGGEENLINTQKRDYIKNKICEENNCLLIRVKYNYKDSDFIEVCNKIRIRIQKSQM